MVTQPARLLKSNRDSCLGSGVGSWKLVPTQFIGK